MKSVPENTQLSKDLSHQISWSTESLTPELPQGLWRSTAAAAQGSISTEAAGKCPCCWLWQYSWQEPVCSWQYLDFPVAQMVKNLPVMKEIRVWSLGWEDPLEKGWQTTSVFLLWESHEKYEKAKRYDTERWTPQVGRCPICYWRRDFKNSPHLNLLKKKKGQVDQQPHAG